MSVPPRVVYKRRQTITALPLYYSGHLLKKRPKEKDFKRYYGELRGATLFLYEDDTQDTYTERLDLEHLKSMELESPYQRKAPTPTIFTLSLHTEELQLKMDNADTGEEWRGYILTVVKKQIPSKLQLLPGQLHKLNEVLYEEKKRNPQTSRPALPPRPPFLQSSGSAASSSSTSETKSASVMPECFFDVTREEAKLMLEENPENGSIILRPSTLANNYALTLRQQTDSGPDIKHYRVTAMNSRFVIELETPVTVSSLNDVLKYFLEKTEYRFHPYIPSQPYDTRIEVSPPPKCISINSSKAVPKAQVAPILRSKTKEQLLPPTPKPVESEYVIPDECPDDQHQMKAQLDGELQEVLKMRRENIYIEVGKDGVNTYKNQTHVKSQINTIPWNTDSTDA
ncbi:signal-transducing adaptor protein 1-like [Melanotaenia boesemani]|uniref:signal-transducing adaptor protein 1-like n=1 Tax=Melanotaenia boesemani TaxID=1250792 RepID=UPI001C0539E5|nr:signal-transducing adaptor protein 1-like [Melanotaenia boesemani]